MDRITPDDPMSHSADLVTQNIDHLRELFPEAFTEGKIDFEVLRELLGDQVDDREEKYGLNWHGKRAARRLALTPSTGTLRPCPEESVDWDTTKNLMIEGDNLEVLKLLQKSYAGKVKLISIDPPYNTGGDFVYSDTFGETLRNYLELTGQVDGEGRRVSTNTEAAGKFHTNWLNMIYPRLRAARDLLRPDGAIFVTIADHEIHNLRAALDDVFGPENFVATVIWQKVFSPKNSARHFSEDHDYVVVYARNAAAWVPNALPRTAEMEARYSNPDNDPRGDWTSGDLSARNYYSEGTYSLTTPSGREIPGPPPGTYWRVSKTKLSQLDEDGRVWWGPDGSNTPRLKRFLTEVKAGRVPQTLWTHKDVGHNQEAKKELLQDLPFSHASDVFETPKPTRLIRRMLVIATGPGDLVVDFFAGSGTTGAAVYAQNAEDGGDRRYVCVQLPLPLDSPAALQDGTSLPNLAAITKERLRRVGRRIREANPLFAGDLGFRVFKLDSSNVRGWDPAPTDLEAATLDFVDHIKTDRSELDLLYEVLLKLGLDLCVPIEKRTFAGKEVSGVGAGKLFACFAPKLEAEAVEAVGLGIVAWRDELKPEGEVTCVFRDGAFLDDVAKTNLAAILEQHGITTVRSL